MQHTTVTWNVVKLLLEHGGGQSVNVKTKDGWTPLMAACSKGHVDVAKALLEAGADVDVVDATGKHLVQVAQDMPLVHEALLAKGKSTTVNTPHSRTKRTPLQQACRDGCLAAVKTLVAVGGEMKSSGADEEGALFCALEGAEMEVVSWLVEQGATIEAGQLVAAVELGFVACDDDEDDDDDGEKKRKALSGMLPEGVDKEEVWERSRAVWRAVHGKEAKDGDEGVVLKSGRTALMLTRNPVVAEGLLGRGGVDVGAKDKLGRTALDWAEGLGRVGVATLIREHVEGRVMKRRRCRAMYDYEPTFSGAIRIRKGEVLVVTKGGARLVHRMELCRGGGPVSCQLRGDAARGGELNEMKLHRVQSTFFLIQGALENLRDQVGAMQGSVETGWSRHTRLSVFILLPPAWNRPWRPPRWHPVTGFGPLLPVDEILSGGPENWEAVTGCPSLQTPPPSPPGECVPSHQSYSVFSLK